MTTAVIQTFPCNSPQPSRSRRRNLDPAWRGWGGWVKTSADPSARRPVSLLSFLRMRGCGEVSPGQDGWGAPECGWFTGGSSSGQKSNSGRGGVMKAALVTQKTAETFYETFGMLRKACKHRGARGACSSLQDPDYHFKGFNSRISSPPPRPPSSFQQKYWTF